MLAMYHSLLAIWQDGPLALSLPRNTAKQLDISQGTTVQIHIDLVDALGNPMELGAGETLTLRIRKTLFAPICLSVTAEADESTPGSYDAELTASETMDLCGLLIYDAWVTRTSDAGQVVNTSYLNVSPTGAP